MTVQRVTTDDIETFTIVTNPSREYASSSISGPTGSLYVFARHSGIEKETRPLPAFLDRTANDANLDSYLHDLTNKTTTTNIFSGVNSYMSAVHQQQASARKQKTLEITRFTPSFTFSDRTVKKLIVKDTLMPYYRHVAPSYGYGFTNFHSLNFFTASSVSTGTSLLYPNVQVNGKGVYAPTGAFTFDFYINPRYTTDLTGSTFKAGTILHLSSTFAVSLVTGTLKDQNGLPAAYRVKLQLSHSADVRPSLATPGAFPNNLVFLSDDNTLLKNRWHHVIIRWGTTSTNNGTGSFVIDKIERGTFVIPSSTITPSGSATAPLAGVLSVGNYYEGTNLGSSVQARFFALDPADREGLQQLDGSSGVEYPTSFSFTHPLNAELHDVAIKNVYASNTDILSGSGKGYPDLRNTLFYLPPFFTTESPYRKFKGTFGGVLQTPFFAIDGTTIDPFNTALSFGVGGHYVNLENFTRDLATGYYPRALWLTGAEIPNTTTALSCNDFLYLTESVRKRNLTILPCDDGNFYPNFDLISTFSTSSIRYRDDLGAFDRSTISLDQLLPSGTLITSLTADSGSMMDEVAGPSPENFGLEKGTVYTIFQRTRDSSSNEVVFFNISNMFYGKRILPGTFSMTDSDISGSNGRVSLTFADDGYGNIYRADCFTSQAMWNSVGNIFYNEGIVLLKTPMVPFFGKSQFAMTFKGEQSVHTMRINVLASANQLNSSSNPTYLPVSASLVANQDNQKFVYVSNLNFHDDNLNVVLKTQLVQPLVKRVGERFLIRTRIDF